MLIRSHRPSSTQKSDRTTKTNKGNESKHIQLHTFKLNSLLQFADVEKTIFIL